jgi:hypothetical protein
MSFATQRRSASSISGWRACSSAIRGYRVIGHHRGSRHRVEDFRDREGCVEAVGFLRDPAGKLDQDAALFVLNFRLGELRAVVELDDLLRLDEQRLPALRRAVHDAAHEAFAVGAHRQHVAIFALRVVGVLQVLAEAIVDQQRRHAFFELRLDRGERAPQRAERVARVIDEPPVGVERLEDRVIDVPEIRHLLAALREPRRERGVLS